MVSARVMLRPYHKGRFVSPAAPRTRRNATPRHRSKPEGREREGRDPAGSPASGRATTGRESRERGRRQKGGEVPDESPRNVVEASNVDASRCPSAPGRLNILSQPWAARSGRWSRKPTGRTPCSEAAEYLAVLQFRGRLAAYRTSERRAARGPERQVIDGGLVMWRIYGPSVFGVIGQGRP